MSHIDVTAIDLWLGAISLVLIICSGLLISAETALSRVSRTRVAEVGRRRPAAVARVERILADRPRYVNVLLFLSTAAMVTATVLIGFVFTDVLALGADWPIGWVLVLAATFMVVVSYVALGVAPRTLGRQHAERIALLVAGPTRFLATVLGPLTTLLILIGNALTPGQGYREGPFATQAEFRELVDMAEAEDLIEDDERQMIHSVF
ncbi:MAG: CNNM domain-containing protein, partial [Actinomycetales bacterium]